MRDGLQIVFTSASYVEAQFIRSMLEGSGVEAVVLDGNMGALNGAIISALGWIKVAVPEEQVDRVRDVFQDYWQEHRPLPVYGGTFHPYTALFRGAKAPTKPSRRRAPAFPCPRCESPCERAHNFCGQCSQRLK